MKRNHSGTGQRLKALVAATPVLGPAARRVARIPLIKELRSVGRRLTFQGSASYWEQRYHEGGTSGAGSYGLLAQFKAETLNDFVERMGIQTVIEFGCGDGEQLTLARYPRYVGIDVAEGSVETCRRRFSADQTKRFYLASQKTLDLGVFDLALSLDVIYHLVENKVYNDYMRGLFDDAGRFVAIYSSNKVEPTDPHAQHVRHRRFIDWIEAHAPEWRQIGYIPNKYPYDPARPAETSFADFYFFERNG
jgi:cyclopropane fatty-acyl-phospholipid synthase-like methyltransferase